jgi:hypothetical protein
MTNNSFDGGATWNVIPGTGPVQPYLIQVNGTAVPEPSSSVLGSIGFMSLLLVSRWSRARLRLG